ncbi:hypothetical protein FVER14953_11054 [Fusarium verticillioides]|nr:hypothetical protein FVER14953_11054 [Fusarium verticillioides]
MSDTAGHLILQDSTNAIGNCGEKTASDKPWARHYHPIKSTIPHTFLLNGFTHANFEDAFIGMMDDDDLRLAQPAVPTNKRYWDFETEADCENWFNTEITNVVLSAWHAHPTMVQTSHTRPLNEENIAENVDCTFSVTHGEKRYTVAIGEFKRNLIHEDEWRNGSITRSDQQSLSRELRG